MIWDLSHPPVRRGLLLRCQLQDWSPSSCQVVDDEVWVSLVLLATIVSLPQKEMLQLLHEVQLHCKVPLHSCFIASWNCMKVFLCVADEHVDIEVIYPLSADGTLLHILLQLVIPRNSLSAMAILSLGMECFGSVLGWP